jgi:hypothetical protein
MHKESAAGWLSGLNQPRHNREVSTRFLLIPEVSPVSDRPGKPHGASLVALSARERARCGRNEDPLDTVLEKLKVNGDQFPGESL